MIKSHVHAFIATILSDVANLEREAVPAVVNWYAR